jgi:hypothetical protein
MGTDTVTFVTERELHEALKAGGQIAPTRKQFAVRVKDAGEVDGQPALDFILSTAREDRHGDTIDPKGWDLADYKTNPVVLWAHDQRNPPVAKGTNTKYDKELEALVSTALFTPKDLYPFGYMICEMYRKGFMNAVSVGFMPLKWSFNEARQNRWGGAGIDFEEQSLLEYSCVPVPSNPDALQQAKGLGIDLAPLHGWAVKALDEFKREADGAIWIPRDTLEQIAKASGTSRIVTSGNAPAGSGAVEGEGKGMKPKQITRKLERVRDLLSDLISALAEEDTGGEGKGAPDNEPDEDPDDGGEDEEDLEAIKGIIGATAEAVGTKVGQAVAEALAKHAPQTTPAAQPAKPAEPAHDTGAFKDVAEAHAFIAKTAGEKLSGVVAELKRSLTGKLD